MAANLNMKFSALAILALLVTPYDAFLPALIGNTQRTCFRSSRVNKFGQRFMTPPPNEGEELKEIEIDDITDRKSVV